MSCAHCENTGECAIMNPTSDYFDAEAEPTGAFDGECMDDEQESCSHYEEADGWT